MSHALDILNFVGSAICIYWAVMILYQVERFCRAKADQITGKVKVNTVQNVYLHGLEEWLGRK